MVLATPLAIARQWLTDAAQSHIVGDNPLTEEELASHEDPGLFGPASSAWRVHGDAAMLIGGLRALLLQSLHPPTMAGVADHSDYLDDPWGRLHRTGRFISATTFGNTKTAEQNIAIVRAIHARVTGATPSGEPYSANDPHLLAWVHITEVDSFLRAYQLYGEHRLTDAECDRYVAEMTAVGHRLGAENLPTTTAALAACLTSYQPECRYDDQARDAVRFLINPPVSIELRGVYALITAAAIALLPEWARHLIGVWVPPGAPRAVQPAATILTRSLGWILQAGGPSDLDGRLREPQGGIPESGIQQDDPS